MESIYKQIDSIFEHGLIKSGVNILILVIVVLIINKLINKIMKTKITDPIKLIFPMRIKKIILITIVSKWRNLSCNYWSCFSRSR